MLMSRMCQSYRAAFATCLVLAVIAPCLANLELTEVDLSTGRIEITNVADIEVSGTLLEFCVPFIYGALESGGFLFAAGETRVYDTGLGALGQADDLWIYLDRVGGFGNTQFVTSGVVWGSSQAGQGRVNSVVDNTLGEAWESVDDFVDTSSLGPGQSLQLQYPGDSPNSSSGWEIATENLGGFTGPIACFDFDKNGVYDCADIDAVVAEIVAGTNNAVFDFNGDGLVDIADRDAWLVEAGMENIGAPYLLGDSNLDGTVDVSDFNIWNQNSFTNTAAWCSGDFNADGGVDTSDFNIWNENKFQSASVVPEPSTGMLTWAVLAGLLCLRSKRRSHVHDSKRA